MERAASYLKKVEINKNSMLFVNNIKHVRHTKGPAPPNAFWGVKWNDIYNPTSNQHFISTDQQSSLNNEYDYTVTEMFRVYLKTDSIFEMPHTPKLYAIDNYFENCEGIIETFKKLMKAIYPRPPTDSDLRKQLYNYKKKKVENKNLMLGMMADIGKLGGNLGKFAGQAMQATAQNMTMKASGVIQRRSSFVNGSSDNDQKQ